jgi:hypothetical protein
MAAGTALPRARVSSRAFKDLKVRRSALGDRDNAEGSATSTIRAAAYHLVDAVLARVDRTRKAVTIATTASDLDTPGWHGVPEWCRRFQVDWVPSKLHKGVA